MAVAMLLVLVLSWLQSAVCVLPPTVQGHNATVHTNVGNITGLQEVVTLPDNTTSSLWVFRGVPYAEPPVGALRFAKPLPKAPFNTTFSATHFGPACPQNDARGHPMSEDCLFLNIYVPATAWNDTNKVAVMVWIHGGSFVSGEGRRTSVENVVAFGDVIVVTINYRLGPLGFLSLAGEDEVQGNQGLYDQHLALLWVKANIAAFGGDAEKITVVGGSAGAMSITYQALFPPSQGLFHRMIAASGTALSSPVYLSVSQSHTVSSRLAALLGCDAGGVPSLVCLRHLDVEDIVSAAHTMPLADTFYLSWAPSEDGYMVRNPRALTMDRAVTGETPNLPLQSMDMMVGTTSSDGSVTAGIFVEEMADRRNESLNDGVSEQLLARVVETMLYSSDLLPRPAPDLVQQAVLQEYNHWEDVSDRPRIAQNTVQLLTDFHFWVPAVALASYHSHQSLGRTYVFEFDSSKRPASSVYPWMSGAPHGALSVYSLGMTEDKLGRTLDLDLEKDRQMWNLSMAVMSYWTNFAKTG